MRKALGWCLLLCCGISLMWGLPSCSPPEAACSEQKPCPAGQICQGGQCVAGQTEANNGEQGTNKDAAVPEQGKPEPRPEVTPKPEKKPLPLVYRWRKVASNSNADLWGVAMSGEKLMWAVGSSGAVLHSNDGGLTWKAQKSGVTVTLRGVSFATAKKGWAVGDQGTVIRTENGGQTWQTEKSISKQSLRGVQFLDDQNGYLSGDRFTLIQTRDGGKTWQPLSTSNDIDLRGLFFVDRSTGYAAGDNGTVLYTRDGGRKLTTAITGATSTLNSIFFLNADKGWVVGEGGTIRVSTNKGQSWDRASAGTGETLHGIVMLSMTRGWIVGTGGVLYGTRDGGKTWRNEARESLGDLHGLAIKSEKAGVAVGKNGVIVVRKGERGECNAGATRACYTGPAATKGVGACKAGTETCVQGVWGECKGQVLPRAQEICNSPTDDNCNGKTNKEDGCPDCEDADVRPCYTAKDKSTQGTGVCRAGTQRCRNQKWGVCEGEVVPSVEDCNGADDDCDGKVDEDLKAPPACEKTVGVCSTGKKTCVSGSWASCTAKDYGADYEDKETKCDGKDNDCDGEIDEGCPCTKEGDTRECYTGTPGTAGVGLCKKGKQTCKAKKWTNCEAQTRPTFEICADKQDNDCDGKVDEKNQYAMAFDGRAVATVSDDKALQPTKAITLEGWFYVDDVTRRGGQTLISRAENGGYGMYVGYPDRGTVAFRVRLGGKYEYARVSVRGVLSSKKWAHIAGTYDGSAVRLWVNGKMVAENKKKGDIQYATRSVPFLFGAEAAFGGVARSALTLRGRIATVKFSNQAIYTKDFTPDCLLKSGTGTVALWPLEEASGGSFKTTDGKFEGTTKNGRWREAIRCPGFSPGGCSKP